MFKPDVFLDTSVLFAAIHSATGGARTILKLGEAGLVTLWVSPWVLREIDAVLRRKAPQNQPYVALLLDQARVQVSVEASTQILEQALAIVAYPGDAQVLAEALTINVDYLVSLDRKHLVGNPHVMHLPFLVGTPADFLAWYRERLIAPAESG